MESPHTLVRIVEAIEGRLELRMELVPRLEYGLVVPEFAEDDGLVRTEGGADRLLLRTDAPVVVRDDRVVARMTLQKGDAVQFALLHERRPARRGEPLAPRRAMDETIAGWRSWSEAHRRYSGPWRREVERSALVLQALTHQPSGAIVGAPTTSLPEAMGGERQLGLSLRVAARRQHDASRRSRSRRATTRSRATSTGWRGWPSAPSGRGRCRSCSAWRASASSPSTTLPHLRGHGGSAPVRVGNAAWTTDAARRLRRGAGVRAPAARPPRRPGSRHRRVPVRPGQPRRGPLARARLGHLGGARGRARLPQRARSCAGWPSTGRSTWPTCWGRTAGERQRLERGARRAPRARSSRGDGARRRHAFAGAFDSDRMDASVLMMVIVGFLPPDDERIGRDGGRDPG